MEDLVEAIARRVVELLREEPATITDAPEPMLWTTSRVAAELGRSAEWVRDHRDELGVVTTSGARPCLMFDRAVVCAWATAREPPTDVAPQPTPQVRRRASRTTSNVPLLRIGPR